MTTVQPDIQELFEAGAHYGYSRSRRHPSVASYLFGTKDRVDVFDLEETHQRLAEAKAFVATLASEGKQILFVGGKHEAARIVGEAGERLEVPYVNGRWIGGTLTNFSEIRRRIERLERLRKDRDSGERAEKYTKRERLMFDREIEELEQRFGGLVPMTQLPAALFVVDPRYEEKAIREAQQLNIPIIALANSDCDFTDLAYPIPANDSVVKSIRYFVSAIVSAYEENKRVASDKSEASNTKSETNPKHE